MKNFYKVLYFLIIFIFKYLNKFINILYCIENSIEYFK